jgi:hypothetical protein
MRDHVGKTGWDTSGTSGDSTRIFNAEQSISSGFYFEYAVFSVGEKGLGFSLERGEHC